MNIFNVIDTRVFSEKIVVDRLATEGIDMSMYIPGIYVVQVVSGGLNIKLRFKKELQQFILNCCDDSIVFRPISGMESECD